MTSVTPPPCPDCSTVTERIEVEGEEVWHCTAPDCTRRTYGTGDENDDQDLPSYSETDEHGALIIYHGTGDIDFEATAELASQDGPDDQNQDDAGPAARPSGAGQRSSGIERALALLEGQDTDLADRLRAVLQGDQP